MKKFVLLATLLLMVVPCYAQRNQRGNRDIRSKSSTVVRKRIYDSNSNSSASTAAASSTDAARRKAINEFLSGTMASYEDGTSLTRSIYGPKVPYIKQGDDLFVLTPHTTTLGPGSSKESSLFIEDNNNIFPGILLWADQGLADGEPRIVGNLARGTVDVMLDIDTGGGTFIVENVPIHYGKIQEAVSKLVRQLYDSGYRQPARIKSVTGDYSSTQEFAIKAGVDVKFAAQFSASMSTTEKSSCITHIDDYSQVYYNVVVQPHKNDWSYLFGEEVTVDDLKRVFQANKNTPMVFVSQMSYGRRLYVLKEFRSSDFKMNIQAKGSYSGVSATSDITSSSAVKESSKSVYVRGGDPAVGVGLIQDAGTVASVISSLGDNALTMSRLNQGVNMAYQTTYIGSQQVCRRSTVGSYTNYDYQLALHTVPVTFRNRATSVAGGHIKLRIDYKVFKLDSNGNKVYVSPSSGVYSGYQRWVERKDKWSKDVFTLPIGEGEYIEPLMHFQLRWKPSTQDWRNSQVGEFEVTGGDIDFTINGYVGVRSGDSTTPYIHSSSHTKLKGFR